MGEEKKFINGGDVLVKCLLKENVKRAKNSGKPAVIDVKIKYDIPDITKLLMSMGSS